MGRPSSDAWRSAGVLCSWTAAVAARRGPPVERRFGYDDLRGLRIGSGADRLDGRPALVVERSDGRYLVADAGLGAPIVQELVERLSDLRLCASRRAIVVVPLHDGALERVSELVSHGPPFDPGRRA
jgi:hypothetical protein